MSKPDGYYCRTTNVTWTDRIHHVRECWGDYPCLAQLIPVYTPLAVPEVTTWGASGGDEAVCCEHIECVDGSGGGGVLDYSLGSDAWRECAASVYDNGEILVHEPVEGRPDSFAYRNCKDVASAIRFVAEEEQ